jgi:hypothetical protein
MRRLVRPFVSFSVAPPVGLVKGGVLLFGCCAESPLLARRLVTPVLVAVNVVRPRCAAGVNRSHAPALRAAIEERPGLRIWDWTSGGSTATGAALGVLERIRRDVESGIASVGNWCAQDRQARRNVNKSRPH